MCPFFVVVAFVVVFNVHIKHIFFLQTVVDVGNVVDDDKMFVIVVAVVVIIFLSATFNVTIFYINKPTMFFNSKSNRIYELSLIK